MAESPDLVTPEPPARVATLQRLAGSYAREHGIAPVRVQRWISFMVLCGALERLRAADGTPAFVIKGGVTLELRFPRRARATKDLDAIYVGAIQTMPEAVDAALANPYAGFDLSRNGDPEDIGKAIRFQIRLAYRGKAWGSVPLEISLGDGIQIHPESVPALSLATFGLQGPDLVSCLPISLQVAQKIHAMTEPGAPGERPNDRFRDLADLLVLRELIEDWGKARRACEATFASRDTHLWPPVLTIPHHWPEAYSRLAAELKIEPTEIEAAADQIRAMIARIATADLK